MIIPILLIGVSLASLVYILVAPSLCQKSMEVKKARRFYNCALIATNTFLMLLLNQYMSYLWILCILLVLTIVTAVIFRRQY